ncbi:nitrate reductase [Amaricoccus solimangrovi]|uniref:Nitrate reductase n=1 Tax=Amaricoccus solimangrovi TaxID=2589815 RepID=A0A501X0V2_9RHOB|nr:nitrate reductase [Amaricoccus solimangrovi]TPE53631.1 nitrate reductase [Amaricoccus solimangrovi]
MSGAPIRTTCPYCGVGCGVLATPDGAGGVAIAGDPEHPANFGRLCSKGSALGQTVGLDGRLLAPRIDGAEAGWDTALDLIATRIGAAIETRGPESVAIYGSGQMLTEDYYVANKLMKGFIGAANIDTNSRLCMASSVAGHRRAFGSDTVPGTYEDLEEADLVVLVGSNLAWCHPVLYQRLAAAKAARPALRVVTVDPRRTATTDLADLHLPLRADTDVALFNALLAEIARRGAVDADYLAAHVAGFDAALDAARATDAAVTGLAAEDLAAFLDLWIGTERVVTVYSQGVNQSAAGTDKVNAIINCHLATGRIGRPGMGPFSVTGQPNAMGGREVGGLSNMLAAHLDLENPTHRFLVGQFWNAPRLAATPGLKAVDLFRACGRGEIEVLWIIGTNPVVSLPEADAVAEAMGRVPLVIVSDMFATTDTARRAHVLLPALGWGEKSGTVTNSERRVSRQRPFLPAPGEARPDWWALAEVGRRLGHAEAFAYESPAEIFREYAALSALAAAEGRDFDISALVEADYDAMPPAQWPVGGPARFFAGGGFFTPDRKGRMIAVAQAAPEARAPRFPFTLNTGRVRDQWHTMTRTGRSSRLGQHISEPFAEINPEDAGALGIGAADLVEVTSPHGTALLRALVTDRVLPGDVFVPMHWSGEFAARARVDALVPAVVDPHSGQPASKMGRVALRRHAAAWYGFAVSRARPEAATDYWALAPTPFGWRAELADAAAPDDWAAFARALFAAPEAEVVISEDRARGTARVALVGEGGVIAALFAAREPVEVARAHIVSAFGTEDPPRLLAGRPGAAQEDRGAIVCACFDVGVNTITASIARGEATSVETIGALLRAGSNCGSCRPELKSLLATHAPRVAAE